MVLAAALAGGRPCGHEVTATLGHDFQTIQQPVRAWLIMAAFPCLLTARHARLAMLLSKRRSQLFFLITLTALTAVFLLPLSYGKQLETAPASAACSVLLWLLLWMLAGRPARFFWLLLPAFLALPVELYLFDGFGQHISPHHLGIIVETSPREALEFLGNRLWLAVAGTVFMLVWFAMGWRAALHFQPLPWRWRLPLLAFSIAGLTLLALAISRAPEASSPPGFKPVSTAVPDHATGLAQTAAAMTAPHWLARHVDSQTFSRSWPFGIAQHAWNFFQERRYLASLASQSRSFRFQASQQPPSTLPQTVVLVIGESSRHDRWSLDGYSRDTNPLLSREANLVSLTDLVTGVSATRLSVPVIMSRKPARQSLQAGFPESSLISAYRESGFKTWWLSNQMSYGKFDTPVSVYAEEADVHEFTNLGSMGSNRNFDEELFPAFTKAIQDPAPRKLIVLHTLGSHWNYSQRYPQSFDRWQPSLFGVERPAYTDLRLKAAINNSYDNSILYTDWFLSQVIGRLKEKAGSDSTITSMFYVADHGQTLYDGRCRLAFHGHNTQFEFHVPALAWYSDLYRQTHPAKVEQLLRHRNARLSTENVFHTMLDMADIHYPGEQPDRSVMSPALAFHPRYVDSYGWANYDNADMKGDCREVIDKGKPLPRTRIAAP